MVEPELGRIPRAGVLGQTRKQKLIWANHKTTEVNFSVGRHETVDF